MYKIFFSFLLAASLLLPAGQAANEQGLAQIESKLPLLGHRNWIVIADSAYPLQTSPGIETITVHEDHGHIVKVVLDMLDKQKHVKPIIYTDSELDYVSERHAPGITSLKNCLSKIFGERKIQSLPHEDIIAKLDKAGKTFQVIIIKSTCTLPYSSVFFELDCGYWNEEGENALREAIKAGKKS